MPQIPCLGYALDADWYETAGAEQIMLVLVGYSSAMSRSSDFVKAIAAKANISALTIDYSGHGDSAIDLNQTRPAQHLLETVIAFDWLRTTYPLATVSVMGASYGGFMAAWLTKYRNFQNLILRTPAIYLPNDFYSLQSEIDRDNATLVYRNDAEALARNPVFNQEPLFDGPTLLVVHEKDEDVPVATTDAYQQYFSADIFVAKGFKHSMRDPENPTSMIGNYEDAISDWLKKS